MFNEIVGDEYEANEYFVAPCCIRADDRDQAIMDLKEMGITEEKLFPDEAKLQALRKSCNSIKKM